MRKIDIPSQILRLHMPENKDLQYFDIIINKWLDLWSISHAMDKYDLKIESMPKISDYEGKIIQDVLLDLNIFLPEIAKREKLALMNIHYDGIFKTRLLSGQIVTSMEETKRPVALPGRINSFETRRDIIYDIYLQFKIPEIKLKGEFFVLGEDVEELINLKTKMSPAKFLISVKDLEINMVMRFAEIDQRFKMVNQNNNKKYNFRRPTFEFDYSFNSYSIEKVSLPIILTEPKPESESKEEEENNETSQQNRSKTVSEINKQPSNRDERADNENVTSEINEIKNQAETEEKHIDSVEEVEALNLNPLYASLVQKVLDQIKTKDISFQKNLHLLIQRLAKFVDKNTAYMPSIFEIGYEMKMLFGYFTTEEYSFKSVKEEKKFLKWVEQTDGYDFIKSATASQGMLHGKDGQKIRVYLDSLTPTFYTPRKYMVDNYEMFYYGNLSYDIHQVINENYWETLNKEYINISGGERERELKEEEKLRFDPLKKAFTNWIKILNIISSFTGLQTLYEFLAYKIATENEVGSEKQIYWDAKIIKTEDMIFVAERVDLRNYKFNIHLIIQDILFSGLSLAKITLSDINIVPIESTSSESKRTDFRYNVFLKIHIPWTVISADYLVKTVNDDSPCFPGKMKFYLQGVNIMLDLSITEIDQNYLYVSELKTPHYFRNPRINFRYTIDDSRIIENTSPTYKGWYREGEDYASYHIKKNSAKRVAQYFYEMLSRRRKQYAQIFTDQIKHKFMAYVIRMPSVFEIIKVIKFILNNNPARSLKYSDTNETKALEKKFFEILSNKANIVQFIENSLKDARRYFSPGDTKLLKSFKQSCLNDEDRSAEQLFTIYNNREL